MITNRNELWGRAVAQELARSGVRDVCLSPGSRSTPLALGVGQEKDLRVTTHIDERSAAFFALGIGKATRRPAVLLCTSGTAAANYLPAIIEASQSRVPLLVLTADRPPELHDVGANQSIDQQHLFGRQVRWFADAGLPQVTAARVRHLRALVCRAVAKTLAPPPGVVHVNFPFQEPLEPTPVPDDVPTDWHRGDLEAAEGREGAPFLRIEPPLLLPDPKAVAETLRLIANEPDGVIVAGPRFADPSFRGALLLLAEATGYPVLADPLSGIRFGTAALVCSAYDAWLANPQRRTSLRPRIILRFGAAPTSKALLHWLKETGDASHIVVDESLGFGEETTMAQIVLAGDATLVAEALAKKTAPRAPSPFAQRLRELDQVTQGFLAKETPRTPFEGAIVQRLVAQLPTDAQLFVSNSLPVRDLDRFGHRDAPLNAFGNRGASGIDGITSTALGIAHATGKKVTLLIGDLAFLHDLSGLVTRRRLSLPLDVLVLNNQGGGIFEFLPIARHEPPFTELFVTPHDIDLAGVARSLGIETRAMSAQEALSGPSALGNAGASRVIVVRTDRKTNVASRRALEAALDAVLQTIAEAPPRAR